MAIIGHHHKTAGPTTWEQPMAVFNHRRQDEVGPATWEQPMAVFNRRRTRV
jgi:hypothetical protein